MIRKNAIASGHDKYIYLNPLIPKVSALWLGGLPSSLLCHLRESLDGINVRRFVPSQLKADKISIMRGVDEAMRIVAHAFEIDIPQFDSLDAWFQNGRFSLQLARPTRHAHIRNRSGP